VLWLQAADAVLLPFAHPESVEPPLTLLEALACGATIIVTSQANRSAVVRDGHNGYLYQGAQLGAQLCKVFRQPEAQTMVAEHGRATVLSEYSFAATADATERLWRNVGERTAHRGLRAGW
jgi:glycosyltransferase involved in cell wall biosynthesis